MGSQKVFPKLTTVLLKLEPSQKEALRRHAQSKKESMSAIVRKWIEEEMINKEGRKKS